MALGRWASLLAVLSASGPLGAPGLGAQATSLDGIGHVVGDPSAPVEVVEFADFACSACAEFWRDTWPSVRTELVETGRVAWRHVPFLLGFRRGDDATRAAECAAEQGAFWAMHDRLFAEQRDWVRGRGHERRLRGYAAEMSLDMEAFDACWDADRWEERTDAANEAAERAGVRGTPTFFINGRQAVGALRYDAFLSLIEAAEAVRSGGDGAVES